MLINTYQITSSLPVTPFKQQGLNPHPNYGKPNLVRSTGFSIIYTYRINETTLIKSFLTTSRLFLIQHQDHKTF